jgi:hypothetical protein
MDCHLNAWDLMNGVQGADWTGMVEVSRSWISLFSIVMRGVSNRFILLLLCNGSLSMHILLLPSRIHRYDSSIPFRSGFHVSREQRRVDMEMWIS